LIAALIEAATLIEGLSLENDRNIALNKRARRWGIE